MTVKAAILGAASYVAGELIKLLLNHPRAELTFLESETFSGRDITAAHPGIPAGRPLPCRSFAAEDVAGCDLVFLCKSHTQATRYVSALWGKGPKIIDLSADFRLQDPALYKQWYKENHPCPQLLAEAVYGLAELYYDKIGQARLIANPGCYPTSIILAAAPLLKAGLIEANTISVAAFSGLSGAGKSPKPGFNLFIDAYANIKPYKAGKHQHLPEIEQELQRFSDNAVQVTFVPHIAPLERGILSHLTLRTCGSPTAQDISAAYERCYKRQPFVRISPTGEPPQVKDVAGSNFCAIGWCLDKRNGLLAVTSVIDNALKGASGQAVQCMNIMYGWPQTMGLPWGTLLEAGL